VRKTIVVGVLAAAAFLVPLVAAAKGGGKSGNVAAGDLKWVSAGKDTPDVQIAPVSGDPSKGASRFFVKVPSGFNVPLHHHSADHFGVVISGTMVFNVDGTDQTLPAGSYFAYTGKKQHTTKCTDPAGCLLFIDAHSKWDVVPEKPAAKK